MRHFSKLLSTTAIAASVSVGSALAADIIIAEPITSLETKEVVFSGVVEFYGGYTFYADGEGNADDLDEDNGFVGGAARINVPWTSSFSTQFDLEGQSNLSSDLSGEQLENAFVGGIHASIRNPDSWLLGAFGGAGTATAVEEDIATLLFAGVEGQLYLQDFTLYGQLGYLDAEEQDGDDCDCFHNAWFARAVGRYFVTPDTLVQAELSYADGEQDTGDSYDMNIIGWGARLEHSYSSVPLTTFVGYEGARYSNDSDGDFDDGSFIEHTIVAGLKFKFGTDSLKDNDRYGATLDLPRFGRWVASGEALD